MSLLTIHDFGIVVEKARQGRFGEMLARATPRRGSRGGSWDHVAHPLKNWWDIPAVMERWNRMTTGDPAVEYATQTIGRLFAGRSALRALSLGCGTGARELALARGGSFMWIDAVDLSRARIEYSRRRAEEAGLAGIVSYRVGDAAAVDLPRGSYDLVVAEQFLHHVDRLDEMLDRVRSFLAPKGIFLFNEYVGPDRWQWTDAQLAAVNALLAEIPERYRARWGSGTVKRAVRRPGTLLMRLYDRTEAVSSSRILPALGRAFGAVETRGYGGAVLQPLFSDIAFHFLGDDDETRALLWRCFEREDDLLARGVIGHDYVIGYCVVAGGA